MIYRRPRWISSAEAGWAWTSALVWARDAPTPVVDLSKLRTDPRRCVIRSSAWLGIFLHTSRRVFDWQRVTNSDSMTIQCPHGKFAHIPGLVRDFRKHISSFRREVAVVAIGVFDA